MSALLDAANPKLENAREAACDRSTQQDSPKNRDEANKLAMVFYECNLQGADLF
jgi:hypothetical protein